MKNRAFTMAAIAIAVVATTSCEHKDLCYDHSHLVNVEVIFDWQNAPEAAPETMSLYFFSTEDGSVRRYEFLDYNGGSIQIAIGEYNAICLNSDGPNTYVSNTDSFEEFTVTTDQTTVEASLTSLSLRSDEEENLTLAPDLIWTDHLENIVFPLTEETITLTLYPEQSVCDYTVEIRNAENVKYVNTITATLTSLAGGLLPAYGYDAVTEDLVAHSFDVYTSDDMTTLTSEFHVFGDCYDGSATHTLTVYAYLDDGTGWSYAYDVTDQIHSAADPRNVNIILDGLPFPTPITNGSGFHPEVEDWEDEEIEIEM